MLTVSTLVIRIVPQSLIKIPSPLATAVVPLEVPPSIRFISAAVVVTLVPPISSVVILTSPATVTNPSATVIKPRPLASAAAIAVQTFLPVPVATVKSTVPIPLSSPAKLTSTLVALVKDINLICLGLIAIV